MRHVVFKTPGLIDIRAFTVMGLSSKPNSDSPIGKFGTGLKMAIAVLVRNGIPVTLWIGRTKYTFRKKRIKFRGEETFEQILMIKEVHGVRKILSKSEELLPFTTELGKFWQLWQAFRELESNTRDEQGKTSLRNSEEDGGLIEPNTTMIIVSGEKFVQEYLDREKTFLPGGLTLRDDSTGDIQIIDRPSECIYWRGIRVLDLPKDQPSQLTYNFLKDIELTEDRTAKDTWLIDYDIKRTLVRSEDENVVQKAVEAPENSYEGKINWDTSLSTVPTPTFSRYAASPSARPSAARLARHHLQQTQKEDPWKKYPRPWKALPANELEVALVDVNNATIVDYIAKDVAELILSKVNELEMPF